MAAVMVAGFAATAQDQKATDVVAANSDKYDFGKIKQGAPVTTYFELRNTSDRPIVIESAVAGCGCTTPEFSKEPIAPNSVTKLKVGYNAAAMGPFTKDVTVKLAGISQPMTLRITGEVVDEANYASFVKTNKATDVKKAEAPKSQVKNKPATPKKTSGNKKK